MIEIYKDTTERLQLKLYESGARRAADGAVTYRVFNNDTNLELTLGPENATQQSDGLGVYYETITDMSWAANVQDLRVEWYYEINSSPVVRREIVKIVQPLATVDDIRNAYPKYLPDASDPKTFDQIKAMERIVRGVIENFTDQVFAKSVGKTHRVVASGADFMQLPERLLSITAISHNGTILTDYAEIDDGGFTLRRVPEYGIPTRDYGHNSFIDRHLFKSNKTYDITGDWGWEYVPSEVNQAAILLVGDYFCNDSTWHAKGIDVVRAADWRVEFAQDPSTTTGSVVADQLLTGYIHYNFEVL